MTPPLNPWANPHGQERALLGGGRVLPATLPRRHLAPQQNPKADPHGEERTLLGGRRVLPAALPRRHLAPQQNPKMTLKVRSAPFLAGAASFLRLSPDGIWPLPVLSAASRASKSLSVFVPSPSAAAAVRQFQGAATGRQGPVPSTRRLAGPGRHLAEPDIQVSKSGRELPSPTRARPRLHTANKVAASGILSI